MLRRIRRLLPHATILICNMYVVFFLIDRVNPAMNFIDNGLTKGLLLILCATAFVNGWGMFKMTASTRRRTPRGNSHRMPAEGRTAVRPGANRSGNRRAPSGATPAPTRSASRRPAGSTAGDGRRRYTGRTDYTRERERL